MTLSVVCGVNWGDEGKGRMVDFLSEDADFVVRYQGGNNAGHTVINEYDDATGRPRRIGHFDAVASRYGAYLQGVTTLAITKLDSLSGRKTLKICTGYRVDGDSVDEFPLLPVLRRCKPVYEEMPGWKENVQDCRRFSDLPVAAQKYIERVEELVRRPIKYVFVGAELDRLIRIDPIEKSGL